MVKNFYEDISTIQKYWRRPFGLILLIFFVTSSWLLIEKLITGSNVIILAHEPYIPVDKLTLLISVAITTIYWFIKTNRIPIPDGNSNIVHICFKYDEAEYFTLVLRLFEKVLKDLKYNTDFKRVKFKILPDNKYSNLEQVETWIKANGNLIHSVILIELKTGNKDNSRRLSVESIGLAWQNELAFSSFGLSKVELVKELQVILNTLEFNFNESNSFDDKSKLQNSFEEFIRFYTAFILAVSNNVTPSINIMKSLYKPNDRIVKAKSTFKDRVQLIINPKNLKAAKYSDLLFHVTIKGTYLLVKDKSYDEALQLLKSINEMDIPNEYLGDYSIVMAYCAYKSGNTSLAIETNNRLIYLGEKYKTTYTINKLFLSIVNEDMKGFRDAFCSLKPSSNLKNVITLIEFYEDERGNLEPYSECFELTIALLEICFIEEEIQTKKKRFKAVLEKAPSAEFAYCIKHIEAVLKDEERKQRRSKNKISKNYNSSRAA